MVEVDQALLFDKRYQEAKRAFGDRWFTLADLVGHGVLQNSQQGDRFCAQMRECKYAEVEIKEVAPRVYRYRFRQAEIIKLEPVKAPVILRLVPRDEEVSIKSEPKPLSEIPEFQDQSSVQYRNLCLRIIAQFGKWETAMTADIRSAMNEKCPERVKDPKRRLGATLSELAREGLLKPSGERRGRGYMLTEEAIQQIDNWGPLDEGLAEIWRRRDMYDFADRTMRTLCETLGKEARNKEEYLVMLRMVRNSLDTELTISGVRTFRK